LAHPAIAALPFHLIDTQGEAWTAIRPLVTSGPYRLTSWSLNQSIQLTNNPNWHAGKPATLKVKWQPMDNKQSGMRLMLSGAADISSDFPDNRFEWLRTNHPSLVHSNAFLATYYFAFNTRRPPFNDVRVRRALAMTVDRQWMAGKMLTSDNQPAWGLLPPGIASGRADTPEWTSWTMAQRDREARRLLSAAGYGPNRPLTFEIRFNNSSEHRRAAVVLATMWRQLGVRAHLLNSEASLHFDSLKRGDFALARSGWVADLPAPENFLAVHRSDAGPQNYSGYANPVFDNALNAATIEPDVALRSAKMRLAEGILLNDMPILPLYFYVTKAMVQPNVSGWHDNIANVHPSYTLAKTVQ
jgi:oligopeptide transport system substrate-binding protein